MRISDILSEGMVIASVKAPGKEDLLRSLSELLCSHRDVGSSSDELFAALMNRERLGSTGVGEGVAIPHAKIRGLASLVAMFARAPEGIPFNSIDRKPARLIFVLLVPENSAGAHLKALARISRLLKNADFRQTLLHQPDRTSLYRTFIEEDAKH